MALRFWPPVSVETLRREIAKGLNSTEDAHRKSMSMFETDEHLQALMFVRSAL
jgi:hypothetical protein